MTIKSSCEPGSIIIDSESESLEDETSDDEDEEPEPDEGEEWSTRADDGEGESGLTDPDMPDLIPVRLQNEPLKPGDLIMKHLAPHRDVLPGGDEEVHSPDDEADAVAVSDAGGGL